MCPEVFDDLPGVVETRVGYTGGANPTPSYRSVCGGAPFVEVSINGTHRMGPPSDVNVGL